MKKKLFYGMMAATMLFATSCQQDDVLVQDGEATISFEVSAPQMATRAFSEGTEATDLTYVVYDNSGARVAGIPVGHATLQGGKTTVNLQLAKGNTYNVLFWADAWADDDATSPYTLDYVNHKLSVNYTNVLCNEEKMDAFYKWHPVTVNGSAPQTVELRRPFAQLNIGTADLEAAKNAGVDVAGMQTRVTVQVANAMDFAGNGEVSGVAEVVYKMNARPSTTENFPVAGYNYLAMNYLLVDAEKSLVDVTFEYTGAAATETRTFGSIPVQRNYRTNIYGNLLTEATEFNVEIKPAYDGAENIEATTVSTAAQLQEAINEGEADMIILDGNIDLASLLLRSTAGLVIPADREVTIDLGGYTLSYASAEQGDVMIQNNGTLTIQNGNVVYTYKGEADSNYGKGNYTISNNGTLNVDANISVDVANYEGKFPHALYAIQQAGTLVVNGGTISNDHNIAIRQWIGSETVSSNITINDGEIIGTRAIWMQLPNNDTSKAPLANVTIKGGTLTAREDSGYKLAIYSYTYGNKLQNVEINIEGGVFNGDIALTGGQNKEYVERLTITGGTFNGFDGDVYSYADNAADAISIKGGEFSSLAPLAYINEADEVLTLSQDVTVEKIDLTASTGHVTIDAAGHTITTESNYGVQVAAGKNITLKNAKVEMTVAGNYITYAAGFKIENGDYQGNTISLENCEIRMCNTDWAYAVNMPANVKNLNLVIDGCTLEGAVALQCWGDGNNITINESNLMCNYTTSELYSSYCVVLQNDGTTISENNTLEIRNSNFLYTGVDKVGNGVWACDDRGVNNTVEVVNCTYGEGVDKLSFIGLSYDKSTKTYVVTSAEGLIALSNKTIKAGEIVTLGANIDLAGREFNGLNAFNSGNNNTFDGQGHTVSNWTNQSGASDMGFIRNWVGPIKNLTISNANLKTGGRSAIVAAKVYGNIENCHVVDCQLVDSYWASGLIAGLYNAGSIKDCTVEGSAIQSNGGTGGIVGVINESAGTRGVYDCSISNSTVNNTGIYGESYSGALVCGMINVDNSTIEFKGCTYEGNTKEGQFVGDLYYGEQSSNKIVVE